MKVHTTEWTCQNGHDSKVESNVFGAGADGKVAFNHADGWSRCLTCAQLPWPNGLSSEETRAWYNAQVATDAQKMDQTAELVEEYIATIREQMEGAIE